MTDEITNFQPDVSKINTQERQKTSDTQAVKITYQLHNPHLQTLNFLKSNVKSNNTSAKEHPSHTTKDLINASHHSTPKLLGHSLSSNASICRHGSDLTNSSQACMIQTCSLQNRNDVLNLLQGGYFHKAGSQNLRLENSSNPILDANVVVDSRENLQPRLSQNGAVNSNSQDLDHGNENNDRHPTSKFIHCFSKIKHKLCCLKKLTSKTSNKVSKFNYTCIFYLILNCISLLFFFKIGVDQITFKINNNLTEIITTHSQINQKLKDLSWMVNATQENEKRLLAVNLNNERRLEDIYMLNSQINLQIHETQSKLHVLQSEIEDLTHDYTTEKRLIYLESLREIFDRTLRGAQKGAQKGDLGPFLRPFLRPFLGPF